MHKIFFCNAKFLGFADGIKVLSPQSLVYFMDWKFRLAKEKYEGNTML